MRPNTVLSDALGAAKLLFATWLTVAVVIAAIGFPYRTDPPQKIEFRPDSSDQKFYDQTYAEAKREFDYVEFNRNAAAMARVPEAIHEFVNRYHLERAHVLDIGAGSGILQDQVEDYTGLDISATARRYFHKPFVQGDARAMPFPDGSFDAAWSVWVLEHVPNPEQALSEIRRVLRPNGLLFLDPAWFCSPFAAQGYRVRPYSDYGPRGKVIKASVAVRTSPLFIGSYLFPSRAILTAEYAVRRRPTALYYWPLEPNYEHYWESDSDAVNSLDVYETYLWFKSRGDVCLNCGSDWNMFGKVGTALIIRVRPDRAEPFG